MSSKALTASEDWAPLTAEYVEQEAKRIHEQVARVLDAEGIQPDHPLRAKAILQIERLLDPARALVAANR